MNFHAELTRGFHRDVTHLRVMFRGSGLGQWLGCLLPFAGSHGGAGLEAEAVIASLEDMAAVGQAIEERGGCGVRALPKIAATLAWAAR